jgi:hypothetical protein
MVPRVPEEDIDRAEDRAEAGQRQPMIHRSGPTPEECTVSLSGAVATGITMRYAVASSNLRTTAYGMFSRASLF